MPQNYELALTEVIPHCPKCGFTLEWQINHRDYATFALLPVACPNASCLWVGRSQKFATVPTHVRSIE